MTGNGQPLASRTPSRSWTPLSRADRKIASAIIATIKEPS